ncbi:MAG TPA: hypothetical protein VK922_13910 [Gemmatimonadaceae bacterium]|nr:hypothetical protein [Gemmatimonadaceae bacterium]
MPIALPQLPRTGQVGGAGSLDCPDTRASLTRGVRAIPAPARSCTLPQIAFDSGGTHASAPVTAAAQT